MGLGTILGGLALSVRPRIAPGMQYYGLLVLGDTIPLWAFVTRNLLAMLIGAFVAGIVNIMLNTVADTAIQLMRPASDRRVGGWR